MLRTFITPTALAVLLLTCSCSKSSTEGTNQEKVNLAADAARMALEKDIAMDVPSLSILIETPDQKYFASSAGKNGRTLTATTHFRFASNTKTFTATAILNMMEAGWLHLDDLITAPIPGSNIPYVPDNAQWNFPHKQQITIKQLLQHSAGVYDIGNDTVPGCNGMSYNDYILATIPGHQFTATEQVNVLVQHNLSYWPPKTFYHYSNTGYTILGEIIARVYSLHAASPKSYGQYLADSIVGSSARVPLAATRFIDLATDQQLSAPYVTGMIVKKNGTLITDKVNASCHVAEGNGTGTMEDLNKYIRTLMKGENVLNPSSIQMMQQEVGAAKEDGGPNNYALGCLYLKNMGYGHNGATEGYLSLMMYDPATDVSVIVLLPFWDLRRDNASLGQCINAMTDAAWGARAALGYPGKP